VRPGHGLSPPSMLSTGTGPHGSNSHRRRERRLLPSPLPGSSRAACLRRCRWGCRLRFRKRTGFVVKSSAIAATCSRPTLRAGHAPTVLRAVADGRPAGRAACSFTAGELRSERRRREGGPVFLRITTVLAYYRPVGYGRLSAGSGVSGLGIGRQTPGNWPLLRNSGRSREPEIPLRNRRSEVRILSGALSSPSKRGCFVLPK